MTSNFRRTDLGISRREAIHWLGLGAAASHFGTLSFSNIAQAQEKNDVKSLIPLNRFSRMVHEHFVDQVRQIERKTLALQEALKTKADAENYVKTVQSKIRDCFGPEPERTPLRAKVTGVVEREEYKIEKVIFESRPEMYVTGNLYIPKNRKFPLPGVVASCGHSTNGKAGDSYQSFAQALARLGYVVLIYDPIGQGERLQYVDEKLQPKRGIGVAEHLHAGNQQFLVGEFFGAWRAWDGIRALDYLLTRDEVDPKHVGITGNSGGGTMTTWLCGLERRWTMAAPSCFVTTFRRNLENELPADTEQCPPRVIAAGLDHCDFLAAMAPKPVIILAKERDYFDARGATEAYQRLKRIYTLLDAPNNIQFFIGPTEHGYSQENREAMYRFFNRSIGGPDVASEPKLEMEKDETLWCTPQGQVAGLKSRTVFSYTQAKSRELTKKRKTLSGESLNATIVDQLKIPANAHEVPDYRILRAMRRNYPKPHSTTYAVETEPGVFAVVARLSDRLHYSRPPQGAPRAVLYVAHHSSDTELREEPLVSEVLAAEPEADFYACDVRGIGESRPDTCGADMFTRPYGNDYFYAAHSIMLDRPYVGQRTFDLSRVLAWLAANGHREIHVVALGWGTLPATFASVLSKHVAQVTLKNSLPSFAHIAENEDYTWPLSSFVPNVLAKLDLPDCYRELEKSKRLRFVSS